MTLPPRLTSGQLQQAAAAAEQMRKAELRLAFDPVRPTSRPTPQQELVLRDIGKIQYRWVVSGNQAGKSTMAAREIAWILNGDHPYGWKRPTEWGTGPLLIIVAGQDRKVMEVELWGNKLSRFFDPEEWREVRAGQALQHVENRRTGDKIVFISHADSSEKNRKHMQGYVAHYVWLDEMPASTKVLEELQRRVDSRNGYFLATFTPKFRNVQIKKIVDSAEEPLGKRYRISKLDNPLFVEHREREIAKLAGYSDEMKNAVLYGTWMGADGLIHEYIPEKHGGAPENYSPAWRHMAVADPATESKLGLTVWAEDPTPLDPDTLQPVKEFADPRAICLWWCVKAEYVEGIYVPTKIIEEVERRLAGLNLTHRRVDSHEAWFIHQAAEMGIKWIGVEAKNTPGRKDGMIRTFQEGLGARYRIADWNYALVDELQSYERNPDTGNIIAKSKFHLIDTCHYFADFIPKREITYVYSSFEHRLYAAHRLNELREATAREAKRQKKYAVPSSGPDIPEPLPPLRQPGRVRNRGWGRRHKIS